MRLIANRFFTSSLVVLAAFAAGAASAADLLEKIEAAGFRPGPDNSANCFASPERAYRDAIGRAGENDRILVFGSFYTVAGVLAYRATQAN